jgi:hypothetical protein
LEDLGYSYDNDMKEMVNRFSQFSEKPKIEYVVKEIKLPEDFMNKQPKVPNRTFFDLVEPFLFMALGEIVFTTEDEIGKRNTYEKEAREASQQHDNNLLQLEKEYLERCYNGLYKGKGE